MQMQLCTEDGIAIAWLFLKLLTEIQINNETTIDYQNCIQLTVHHHVISA